MDPNDAQIRAQREAFVQAFLNLGAATANLHAMTKKQIELTNQLINSIDAISGAIVDPKNGLLAALDDLSDEIRALRQELGARARR